MKYTAPKADLIDFDVTTNVANSIISASNDVGDAGEPFSLRNRDAEAQDSVGNGSWE